MLDFLIQESAKDYHAQAKDYLSSHALADFRRSPILYRKKQLGLIPDKDRPAYVVGRAAHTCILEGIDVYAKRYAFGRPVNKKTGEVYGKKTKAYMEWEEQQGKPVLTHDQDILIQKLSHVVYEHEEARELLSTGIPEGTVRGEYLGIPAQARPDYVNENKGLIELKTCDKLDFFESDARRYQYMHQLAFYRSVLAPFAGGQIPAYFIAVEKQEPFRVGVWRVGDDALAVAAQENDEAVERLRVCIEKREWKSGYEEVRTFEML